MTLSAIFGTIIIVGITLVIGFFVEKKTPKLEAPKKKPKEIAGETPGTAVKKLDKQRCCDQDMVRNFDDRVKFDGKDLLIARFTCTTCAKKRSIYVDTTADRSRR